MLRADENANRKMVSCGTNFLTQHSTALHKQKKKRMKKLMKEISAKEKSFTLPWRDET